MKPKNNEFIFIDLINKGEFDLLNNKYNINGYPQVRKMINGKRYSAMVHRIVWIMNYGQIPEDKIVNHMNGIKSDFRIENLELTDYSGNTKHAFRLGLKDQYGEKNPACKLKDKEIFEIRELYKIGNHTLYEIAKIYNVSYKTISKIVRGERRIKQAGHIQDYSYKRKQDHMMIRDLKGKFLYKKKAGYFLDDKEHREIPDFFNK
ncbi:MAG: hypothetical protein A2V66_16780 [Ignavibacteria bacterium RBG_13_36_8]|nr:MAG: hypothetical protein A2V66_16780 [Ignavibacteria bacterium RBG_13_36_8]